MNYPLLQPPLQNDARMEALARLIARLSVLPTERPLVNLADTVAASALSALGEQFHIMGDEGWNYARTEAERRALIKKAVELHRHKGTPWAVRTAIDTALGTVETRIEEWFAYGGEPYRFRLFLSLLGTGILAEELAKARAIALETKNVRSHLDGLTVVSSRSHEIRCGATACVGGTVTIWPAAVTDIDAAFDMHAGCCLHLQHTVTIFPEDIDGSIL